MSQKQHILAHLERHGTITPLEALNLFGCFRLAARIAELRAEGHDIRTCHAPGAAKDYAVYRLHREPAQLEMFA